MDYFINIFHITCFLVLLSISGYVILGRCGQLSLGQAGFAAIGAYTSAILTKHGFLSAIPWIGFIESGMASMLLAAVAAAGVGVLTLRLKGDYLAVVTLCAAEIIRLAIIDSDALQGARGIGRIGGYSNIYMSLLTFIFAGACVWRIDGISLGRQWLAVREDSLVAQSFGISLAKAKVSAFAVSGAIAGLAGHLYCQSQSFVHPNIFGFQQSIVVLLMTILGGLGSLSGAVLGAVLFALLPEILRFAGSSLSVYRLVIFSIITIVLILFRPQGLLGRAYARVSR